MRKVGYRAVLAAFFLLMAVWLGGCREQKEEEEWIPQRSALQAPKGGPVTETLIETLDEDYYDSAELEKTVRDTTEEYNLRKGGSTVEVVSYSVDGKTVRLVMNYKDMKVYNDFNKVKLFNGSILGAQMEGFPFDREFYHAEAGVIDSEPLPGSIPVSQKQYQVFIGDLFHAVEVPGDIVYITTNAQLLGPRIAAPAVSGGEEGTDGYMYVIYEF